MKNNCNVEKKKKKKIICQSFKRNQLGIQYQNHDHISTFQNKTLFSRNVMNAEKKKNKNNKQINK